ncbi:MAG: hypothetical protein HY364_01960 [Candidatus Aenigmarchaeota archaeon]|nr:hypothetical protein [Candidatus Aenigmarchaeota archaeon]
MKQNAEITAKEFFRYGLLPFYDVMSPALPLKDGHMLYRLSDFMDEDTRRATRIKCSATWHTDSMIRSITDKDRKSAGKFELVRAIGAVNYKNCTVIDM